MSSFSRRFTEWRRSLVSQPVIEEMKPTRTGLPYRPLHNARDEIRLLELLPDRSVQPPEKGPTIQCLLRHASLRDAEYLALSYVWGDATQTSNITVEYEWTAGGGSSSKEVVTIPVTDNLASALAHLRYSKKPLILWVDAICINQQDDLEKSDQILKMGRIYEKARKTIVWLGPAEHDSDKQMKYISKLGKDSGIFQFYGPGNNLRKMISDQLGIERRNCVDSRGLSMRGYLQALSDYKVFRELKGLDLFLKRAWWTRAWVLQEFVKSNYVEFHCGLARISEDRLCPAIEAIAGYWYHLQDFAERYGRNSFSSSQRAVWNYRFALYHSDMVRERKSSQEKNALFRHVRGEKASQSQLGTVLESFSGPTIYATDPRDRIWALLGLSYDHLELGIVPDYSQSTEKVYINTTRALLAGNQGDMITLAQPDNANLSLPSWVVDWTSELGANINSTSGPVDYKTCGNTQVSLRPALMNEYLFIEGVRLGKISSVSRRDDYTSDVDGVGLTRETWPLHAFRLWMTEMVKVIKISLPVLNPMQLKEVLFRILTCNPQAITHPDPQAEYENCTWENFRALDSTTWMQEPSSIDRSKMGPFLSLGFSSITQRMIGTQNGLVGYGHYTVKTGDLLIILFGVNVPMIIRETGNGRFRIVGTAYIDGIMMGEYIKRGGYIVECFELE
jgi:hypothetical protein